MKIVYDTEKHGIERCMLTGNDGIVHPIGAFWIQVETTDLEKGKGREVLNIKRWGSAKERDRLHAVMKETSTTPPTNPTIAQPDSADGVTG